MNKQTRLVTHNHIKPKINCMEIIRAKIVNSKQRCAIPDIHCKQIAMTITTGVHHLSIHNTESSTCDCFFRCYKPFGKHYVKAISEAVH